MTFSTRQIHEQGKALVRSRFEAHQIEIQDSIEKGHDFFCSSRQGHNLKIKVTTKLQPTPSAGKGRLSLDWWVLNNVEADVIAFVDLQGNRIWLAPVEILEEIAQQHSSNAFHLYMYVDSAQSPRRDGKKSQDYEFKEWLIENSISKIF